MEASNVVHLAPSHRSRAPAEDRARVHQLLALVPAGDGAAGVRGVGRGGSCPVAGRLHHYVIPRAGRWLVVYRLPGIDGWEQPVSDCPSQAVADREAERLNGEAA